MQGGFARAFKRSPAVWERQGGALLDELLRPLSSTSLPDTALVSDQSAGPALWETGPYAGPRWKRIRQGPYMLTAHLTALATCVAGYGFDELRVLLVFRRQDEWIASKYAQRSDRILRASQAHFEQRVAYYMNPARGFYADGLVLDYALLRQLLVEALGEERVLLLPYVLLKHDPLQFLRHIHIFVHPQLDPPADVLTGAINRTKENVRSTAADTWRLRPRTTKDIRLPSWLPRPLRAMITRSLRYAGTHLFPQRDRQIKLTPALRQTILDQYRESNRKLEAVVPGDLEAFGYYTE